jgi:hypothetical protein
LYSEENWIKNERISSETSFGIDKSIDDIRDIIIPSLLVVLRRMLKSVSKRKTSLRE